KEIGLEPLPINNWDGTILNGEFVPDTWGDGLDKLPYPASVRESFKKCKHDLLAIDSRKRAFELFNLPFSDFLKGYAPEVKSWWDTYGPSNWGATSESTAAALAIDELKSIAAEDRTDIRYTWPGGIGALSKRLSELLQGKFADHMQTGATTIAVVPQRSGVHVTYMQNGGLKTVAAKAVIMASPKFITRRLIEGLPEKQSEAMHQIHYIPYPVVNLILRQLVSGK
ncbi:MAG: hypothetical protein DMG68_03785, partial [Acidobacteria bacterium]